MGGYPKMTLQEIVENTLGLHLAFQALGFESKDVFVIPDNEKISVVLRVQGKQFAATAGPRIVEDAVFREAWLTYLGRWNTGEIPDSEGLRIYRRTGIPGHAMQFVMAVKAKGILPPLEVEDMLEFKPKAKA